MTVQTTMRLIALLLVFGGISDAASPLDSFLVFKNRQLTADPSHVIRYLSKISSEQCAAACLGYQACKAFNFFGGCMLLSTSRQSEWNSDDTTSYTTADNADYYELAGQYNCCAHH